MKRFGLIGAAGYIAPRHLRAIKETGNNLVVAMDINDSVGIMDRHFAECEFFTEFEQFEAFVGDEKLKGRQLDYLVICSPNYLHVPHMKFSLRNGINVICEKPLVLNSADLDVIRSYENSYGATVSSILQLRLHPTIIELRRKVQEAPKSQIFDVELTYITSRGKWYMKSWKGADQKSGGLGTNIGVHFYDMLHFVFGNLISSEVHCRNDKTAAGYLVYERARVRWFLSVDSNFLPENAVHGEKSTYRSIQIGSEDLEFSDGFDDLHTMSYKKILDGKGFGVDENRNAISVVEAIRTSELIKDPECFHPFLPQVA